RLRIGTPADEARAPVLAAREATTVVVAGVRLKPEARPVLQGTPVSGSDRPRARPDASPSEPVAALRRRRRAAPVPTGCRRPARAGAVSSPPSFTGTRSPHAGADSSDPTPRRRV